MKNNIRYAYQLILFFMFLKSLSAWFTWEANSLISILYIFVTLIYVLAFKEELYFKKNALVILMYVFSIISLGYGSNISKILGLVPIVIFIATSRKFKVDTLKFITRGWLYILIPSLLLFLCSFLMQLPNLGQIEHPNWDVYNYTNYIFFIKGQFYDIRFNSIFLEPGHLGMVLSFFLYAYRFDFSRWEVWGMLVIEFFTFSLAGYVLVAIGYTLALVSQNKSFFKFVFSVLLFFGSIYICAISYNGGDNLLNQYIISRLEFDEEKGLAGNNRFTSDADDYVNSMLSNGKIWWGLPEYYYKDDNLGAGWKVFLIRYGAFSMIIFISFYFIAARKNSIDKKYNMLFLVLLFAAFLQRSYPWWESWIIPFFCGINYCYLKLLKNQGKLKNKYNGQVRLIINRPENFR
ncbi:hypothetical protein [Pontibacter sp. SGAir0037]|uniref:hypothetical protein n=1 Tax=Pontibacter sp. SGAir0037 TaxID=2571030 RepID=UPI0010CD1120|nr:hypothetical protein [Pontibacter sp. SGAir0037]QCR20979.1 hypothetical protein C1N53_00430 [Pontibacter sp. SGAir0037]